MTNRHQMEMSFDSSAALQLVIRPRKRLSRARWWFAQMHALVDRAMDWQPAPPARPEQTYLTLARNRS